MTRLAIAHTCAGLLVSFLIALPRQAFGYRPFVSTDAAVADVSETEIELGYFNWEREKGNTTFISPKAVLNYGFSHNFEVVGEFAVEEPGHGSAKLIDAALSVKAVLKDGSCRKKMVSASLWKRDRFCHPQTKTKEASALKA